MADKRQRRIWRGLLQFYGGNPWSFAGAMLFTIGAAMLSLLLPLIFSFIVDSVLNDHKADLPAYLNRLLARTGGRTFLVGNLWLMGLLLVLISFIEGILVFFRGKWNAVFSETGALRMRTTLYDHIQKLPFSYHARAETGDLVQRCTSDVETVGKFFGTQMLEVVRSLTLVVFSIVIMVRSDLQMALISLAITPVLFGTSALYFRKERDAFRKWDETEGELSATLQESLTGIRVVKAFARQSFEKMKFAAKNRELLGHGWKTYQVIADFWMWSDFLCLFQVGAVTIIGTLKAIAGDISLGELIVFVTYTEMLLYPLRGLARVLADTGKMQISLTRIQEILSEPPEAPDDGLADPVLQGGIEFSRVNFSYSPEGRQILTDISFVIHPGETIGLIGPTGSGKSTLLYLLQRLHEPTSGSIRLDGADISGIRRDSVRRQIGLILQEPFIFSRSIFENIRLPRPDAAAEAVYDASRAAALHHEISAFNEGYDTMVGERGVTLSGGQQQRLTIARTLIRECPIVIFDDSLSSVDTRTDQQIRQELRQRRERATTLLVSHRIATLAEADRILVLENGCITAFGTHQELIRIPGLYQRIHQIQNSLADLENPGGSL